ncbi:MAG: hypothetical protein PHW56_07565 [Methanosarcinaceae archaeon]|nr:hypothetical protein [Methanosarcinaceae archaeon]
MYKCDSRYSENRAPEKGAFKVKFFKGNFLWNLWGVKYFSVYEINGLAGFKWLKKVNNWPFPPPGKISG